MCISDKDCPLDGADIPKNLNHVANFPQMKSRMIAPMIDGMNPAG
jgi:hypothetical protein